VDWRGRGGCVERGRREMMGILVLRCGFVVAGVSVRDGVRCTLNGCDVRIYILRVEFLLKTDVWYPKDTGV